MATAYGSLATYGRALTSKVIGPGNQGKPQRVALNLVRSLAMGGTFSTQEYSTCRIPT